MDTYQKSLTDENRDLMVVAGATSLRSKTTDHGKASDHDVISKAGGASFTGRTFAGSVHARYLRGRLVAGDGHPVDGRTGRILRAPGMQRI